MDPKKFPYTTLDLLHRTGHIAIDPETEDYQPLPRDLMKRLDARLRHLSRGLPQKKALVSGEVKLYKTGIQLVKGKHWEMRGGQRFYSEAGVREARKILPTPKENA